MNTDSNEASLDNAILHEFALDIITTIYPRLMLSGVIITGGGSYPRVKDRLLSERELAKARVRHELLFSVQSSEVFAAGKTNSGPAAVIEDRI